MIKSDARKEYATRFNFRKGIKIIIVDTNRNDFPEIGDVGEVVSIFAKDGKRSITVKWQSEFGYIEKLLDEDDFVDLYEKCEQHLLLNFTANESNSFQCTSCGEILENPMISFFTITRDLFIHNDIVSLDYYKENSNAFFELYGGEQKVKRIESYVFCPKCNEHVY